MQKNAELRNETLAISANRVPLLGIDDLARLGTELPELLPDIAKIARKHFPRSGLGRLA